MTCLKAVAYVRVSSEEQRLTGYSIEAQLKAITKMCATSGVEVVTTFQEYHSAMETGRPEFDRMVTYLVENPEIRAVAVDKCDRFSRNHIDVGVVRDKLHRRILSVREPSDDSPLGHFQQDLSFSIASLYSKNLSVEAKKGLRAKFESGGFVTLAPFGYKHIPRTRTERGRVEIDEDKAKSVRKAFEMYATGRVSIADIALELANDGVLTSRGRPFGADKVHRMLRSKAYIGFVHYGPEVRKGVHDPIVTNELFDEVQQQLARRAQEPGERGRLHFLLRGLLVCGTCSRHVTAERHARGSYYRCSPRLDGTHCKAAYAPLQQVDDQVLARLGEVTLSKETVDSLCAELEQFTLDASKERSTRLKKAQRSLRDTEAALNKLVSEYVRGHVPEGSYLALKAQLTIEVAKHSEQTALLSGSEASTIADLQAFVRRAGSLRRLIELTTAPSKRKELIASFVRQIWLENRKVTRIEYHAPFDRLFGDSTPSGRDLLHS